jgi:hypothetical protein
MVRQMVLVAGMLVGIVGCDGGAKREAPAAAAPAEALPEGLIVAQAPADAKNVADVRKTAADGEEVVVRGRIAGQADPFTDGRAQFQLVDAGVKACSEMEMADENCKTPWDMCCESPKDVAANSVTVQVVNAEGRPLKAPLKGVGGLKPLSEVSVKGTVHKSADGKVVTVNAKELYVKQG